MTRSISNDYIEREIATIYPIQASRETVARVELKRLIEGGVDDSEFLENITSAYRLMTTPEFRKNASRLGMWRSAAELVAPHFDALQARILLDLFGLSESDRQYSSITLDIATHTFPETMAVNLSSILIIPRPFPPSKRMRLEQMLDYRVEQSRTDIRDELLKIREKTGIEALWDYPRNKQVSRS